MLKRLDLESKPPARPKPGMRSERMAGESTPEAASVHRIILQDETDRVGPVGRAARNHHECEHKCLPRREIVADFLYKIPQSCVYWLNQVHIGPINDNGWCEQLYEDQAAKLILYGRALGLSHAESEDVLQETFIALLKLATPPERPEHYGLRSFRNRALNYRRHLWQRIRREFESHRWFEIEAEETPHEQAAMRCLAGLPREQREVIVLKIWHDRTFEEIGALLAVSPNTAAGRYRYGIQKIRTYFERKHYEAIDSLGKSVAPLDPAPPCLGT